MKEKYCCEHCDDGSGESIYPYYGLAPHNHDLSITGSIIGSTVFTGKIPENFSPDMEEDGKYYGCGTYTHCLHCGN